MHRVWLPSVLLALMLSGCATTDVKLKLPPTGLPTAIPGGSQRQIVLTMPFADARQVPTLCGVQKSGYGDETATVYCEDDPAGWIAHVLAAELKKSGFTVLSPEEGARDNGWVRTRRVKNRLVAASPRPIRTSSMSSAERSVSNRHRMRRCGRRKKFSASVTVSGGTSSARRRTRTRDGRGRDALE
jgi:hypothetical protein